MTVTVFPQREEDRCCQAKEETPTLQIHLGECGNVLYIYTKSFISLTVFASYGNMTSTSPFTGVIPQVAPMAALGEGSTVIRPKGRILLQRAACTTSSFGVSTGSFLAEERPGIQVGKQA